MDIKLVNVSKSFQKKKIIKNISCKIKQGDITGLLGQNGAGKSTIMKMIVGQIQTTSGSIYIGEKKQKNQQIELKKKIGYLSEKNPLYSHMYVNEFLFFIGKIYGLKKNEIYKKTEELIQSCMLQTIINKKIEYLSKGQKQRIGIAKTLIHDPEILILDEPTSGLDPIQLHTIRALLINMKKKKTILFSTHIMQEVKMLCDKIFVIHQGNIKTEQDINTKSINKTIVIGFKQKNIQPIHLMKIPNINNVIYKNDLFILSTRHTYIQPIIFQWACAQNLTLTTMYEKKYFNNIHL